MIGRIIGSLVVIAALTACQRMIAPGPDRPLPTLVGTQWGLTQPGGIDQSISFQSSGEVSGSTGCNSFFGTFTQQGPHLTFGPLASTRRACPEPLMSAESQWFNALARARSVNASSRELVLFGENGEVLIVLNRRG